MKRRRLQFYIYKFYIYIKGEPKTFFSKLSAAPTDSFAHAKAALEERFKSQYQQELADRRQLPGESVIELKSAIIELVSKAYPEVTESVAQNAMVVATLEKLFDRIFARS